jgi:Ca-activated chloride channel family protein
MTDFAAGQVERVVARLTLRAPEAGKALDVAQVRVAYTDALRSAPSSADARLSAMVSDKREEVLARRDREATVIATRALAAENMEKAANALSKGDSSGAQKWVDANKNVFFEAEAVTGHAALAADEEQFQPPPAAFAAAPAEQVQTTVKAAKAKALQGFGRIGSTY